MIVVIQVQMNIFKNLALKKLIFKDKYQIPVKIVIHQNLIIKEATKLNEIIIQNKYQIY
jgi:hypothetical protein